MYRLFDNDPKDNEFGKPFASTVTNHCTDEKFFMPGGIGNGTLEVINFKEGICLQILDCNLNKPLKLHQISFENKEDLFFTLTYCITTKTFFFQDSSGKDVQIDNLWNTVFSCNRADLKFNILPHAAVKCVSIRFTKRWIEQAAAHVPPRLADFISWLINNDHPVFYFESHNAIEKKMISDVLSSKEKKQSIELLFLKSRIVTLIDEFLKKSSQRRFIRGTENKSKYELIIRQVAAELMNNLFETLPSLTEISRKFAISESTLKRNFKIIYNKSITEYYLEKKMSCAKMLVSECNKTITEIAYLLGYEKVSHFISQFKKYNGCLPGLMQKTLIKQIA
jgi:AraC-like DNA-binding protein